MRLFLLLASLAMLLLPSCKPAGGSSSTGSNSSKGSESGATERLKDNTISNAEMAAVDSLGKRPPPLNMIAALDNICPVHRRKMKTAEIPIVFEDNDGAEVEATAGLATAEFPFGAEKLISAGNALLPGESLTARVYQCPNCMAQRKAADESRKFSARLTAPQ